MAEPRDLTAHERMAGRPWDDSYRDGPAPWEIGGPQPAVVRLGAAGAFASPTLDAGCGSGDNALHIASLGVEVFGFDVAETAVEAARRKASAGGVHAEFAVGDAFQLEGFGRSFATVLDCGLFHALDTEERARYAASLASVTSEGGRVYVLCFGDEGDDLGPHPVSRDELYAAFDASRGWRVESIESERLETRFHANGAPAWLATVTRI